MNNSYEVLGVTKQATQEEIRQRYLELIREFSPERAPERFAEIREAYEKLQDPLGDWLDNYCNVETKDSIDDLIQSIRKRTKSERFPTAALLAMAER